MFINKTSNPIFCKFPQKLLLLMNILSFFRLLSEIVFLFVLSKMSTVFAPVFVIPLDTVATVSIPGFPASKNVGVFVHFLHKRKDVFDGVFVCLLQHDDVFLVVANNLHLVSLFLCGVVAQCLQLFQIHFANTNLTLYFLFAIAGKLHQGVSG